jgi:hypothetical protein
MTSGGLGQLVAVLHQSLDGLNPLNLSKKHHFLIIDYCAGRIWQSKMILGFLGHVGGAPEA